MEGKSVRTRVDLGGGRGSEGNTYVFVKTAGGPIASGAAVILTEPAMTVATGAGAFTAPVTTGAAAIPVGSFIHVRRTTL